MIYFLCKDSYPLYVVADILLWLVTLGLFWLWGYSTGWKYKGDSLKTQEAKE